MRVFLAGASGVIGRRLLPLLLAAGHEVTGACRSAAGVEQLRRAGAPAAVQVDVLDARAVREAVLSAQPEALIHQATAIPARIDPRRMRSQFALNDRIRAEGTEHLLAAAREAGTRKIIAQSIAFAYAPGPPGTIHREQDPLFLDAEEPFRRSVHALAALERTVLAADGVVLRYGYFYGPGSAFSREGAWARDVARRRLPIVGRGEGVWSFIHVEDAAAATVAALAAEGQASAGAVYNVVDEDPAPVDEWLPALAAALQAPKPRRVPALLARAVAGRYGVATMTEAQGASGALARERLGWRPRLASWREGFLTALG